LKKGIKDKVYSLLILNSPYAANESFFDFLIRYYSCYYETTDLKELRSRSVENPESVRRCKQHWLSPDNPNNIRALSGVNSTTDKIMKLEEKQYEEEYSQQKTLFGG